MKKIALLALFGYLSGGISAQSIFFSLPDTTVEAGTSVVMPLRVMDFDSMVSIQFSINWDTEIAAYDGFSVDALPLLAVGDFQSEQGELRISWFDNTGQGRSLADGAVIANFQFTATGEPGDFTLFPITGDPLAVQLRRATGVPDEFIPVALEQSVGRIAIAGPLGFSLSAQDATCFGADDGAASVTLAVDTAGYDLQWTGPGGFNASGFSQANLEPGEYQIELLDQDGTLVFSYQLTIAGPSTPLRFAGLSTMDSDCESPSGTATLEVSGGQAPYTILLNGMVQDDTDLTGLAAGSYLLRVTDALQCVIDTTFQIAAPGAPVLDLPDTVLICGNESIVLRPAAEGAYLWSTGATTDTLLVEEAGAYSLTVTAVDGCQATATVTVLPGGELEAMLATDFLELCPGDSLQLLVTGGTSYQWLNGTGTLSAADVPNPLAFPNLSFTYRLRVANACAADTLEVPVLVYQVTATAGPDTCIAPGETLELAASGGIFYEWADNAYPVSDPIIPNPKVQPEDSTTYRVTITDINGCVTEDEVAVMIADDPTESVLAINLLTPNGDGLNDVLDFGPIGKYGPNDLKVYNRWGKLVYQKLNYQTDGERFDGTYQNQPLPPGSYFYVLSFRQAVIKQTLTLVRE